MALHKKNVLANVSGTYEPFGSICWKMATRMQRSINVSHVKTLLSELVNEGAIETHTRNSTLHYRKS